MNLVARYQIQQQKKLYSAIDRAHKILSMAYGKYLQKEFTAEERHQIEQDIEILKKAHGQSHQTDLLELIIR